MNETLEEITRKLKEKWGDYDSEALLHAEVKTMNHKEREEYLNKIADLYLDSVDEKNY
ncbi:hypothetical protein M0R72_04090 [Candidatus Pacearchaeota archaeon]|jgi:hypothetical protein|nr:hypothetical protein [Candidatus Pacearchaeota archaeon]